MVADTEDVKLLVQDVLSLLESMAMSSLEVHGIIDEAGRLLLDEPLPLPPGKVRVQLDVIGAATALDDEADYRALVDYTWAESLNDPREDIYTENDGKPIDPMTGEVVDDAR
jgi:hypothetical protein